jgi:glycosyltransferase involved in cell wall biosynthesis
MSEQQALNIVWLADALQVGEHGTLDSPVASTRLRVLQPALALRDMGHRVDVTRFENWSGAAKGTDVVVVGKLLPSTHPDRFTSLAPKTLLRLHQIRAAGVCVVADISDLHFDHPIVGGYWRELAAIADACVAASQALADAVRTQAGMSVHVVPDPLSSPRGDVRPALIAQPQKAWLTKLLPGQRSTGQRNRLKLVWYGHPNNFAHLLPWLDALGASGPHTPWLLWVVTEPDAGIRAAIERAQQQLAPHGLIDLVEWSDAAQWSTVADAEVVLLPSDPRAARTTVKSANRLTDALHAGRPVIATRLPSYEAYADHVQLTDDPVAALADLLARPDFWRERTTAGQAAVIDTLSPSATARTWEKVLRLCLKAPARPQRSGLSGDAANPSRHDRMSAPTVPPESNVRLNLGCGDKILPGYVNVDVVASRAGREPDVICDLHDLTVFADDSADEIMAVHVVEHFWRWEVEAILTEWLRVLKPGGRMVLECPNLLSACRELLEHPETAAGHDRSAQRTLWVLYGDPAWRDPLMTHRWGYTPASLAALMQSVGLHEVRQEPAQYKLREPRDMRIVGVKK